MNHNRRSSTADSIESSSGYAQTWPILAVAGATERTSIRLVQDDVFTCEGGVDVGRLLRGTRDRLYNKALAAGDSYVTLNRRIVLVDERWQCSIGPPKRQQNSITYRVTISYRGSVALSNQADPERPVALDEARSIPGLMTVITRN